MFWCYISNIAKSNKVILKTKNTSHVFHMTCVFLCASNYAICQKIDEKLKKSASGTHFKYIFHQRKIDVIPHIDKQISAVTGAVVQQQLCSIMEAVSLPPSISMSEAPGPPPHPPQLLLLLPAPCIKKRHCRLQGGREGGRGRGYLFPRRPDLREAGNLRISMKYLKALLLICSALVRRHSSARHNDVMPAAPLVRARRGWSADPRLLLLAF